MAAAGGPAATAAAAGEEEAGESRKLFVGGIPAGAQEPELRAHFARFGEVRSVIVMRDRETGHGRGFGFVEFEDEAAAAAALGDGDRPRHFLCGRMVSLRSLRSDLVMACWCVGGLQVRVALSLVGVVPRGFTSIFPYDVGRYEVVT